MADTFPSPTTLQPPALSAPRPRGPQRPEDVPIWEAAKRLEATFLSEMLKSAGYGEARESMGGGIGEEQFASFLRERQAQAMADAGGIGLAQSLFEALKARSDAAN